MISLVKQNVVLSYNYKGHEFRIKYRKENSQAYLQSSGRKKYIWLSCMPFKTRLRRTGGLVQGQWWQEHGCRDSIKQILVEFYDEDVFQILFAYPGT